MMVNGILIKHVPEGKSPYENFGYERLPRYQKENEKIKIGASVEPYSPSKKVMLAWLLNGKAQKPVEGRIIKFDPYNSEKYFFEFDLGKFSSKDYVQYWIEVRDNETVARSRVFDFSTLSDFGFKEPSDISLTNGAIRLEFGGTQGDEGQNVPYRPVLNIYFENSFLRIKTSIEEVWDEGGGCCSGTESKYENSCCDLYAQGGNYLSPGRHEPESNFYTLYDDISGHTVEVTRKPFSIVVRDSKNNILFGSHSGERDFIQVTGDYRGNAIKTAVNLESDNKGFYGFGERFNSLNQRGLKPDIYVIEQYTYQKEKAYTPIPFFFTESGYGMYMDESFYIKYGLSTEHEKQLSVEFEAGKEKQSTDLYILFGKPLKIIKDYMRLTGHPLLPPKWAFGPWMSSNAWNTQKESLKQVEMTLKYKIPATVFVLEAWSDENTFYIFNDAEYETRQGGAALKYGDFSFPEEGKWPDPKGMVEYLHKNNLRLILWQNPVIKHVKDPQNRQHMNDEEYVLEKKLCVTNADGTPYRVVDNWFCNSLVLDFTNPEAREWWFGKRRYLLEDVKIDGFKTDGGEFVHDRETCFYNGKKGREMRNQFPVHYMAGYNQFCGKDRVVLGRAGFSGIQKYSMLWGGDQYSSFEEIRSLLVAGLSANISGIPFWGFDIAGFSGEMPTPDLYIRSFQMAAFCPMMQYHSAPREANAVSNDRTPWNVAEHTGNEKVLDLYRKFANLRMNIMPYIYDEACYVAASCEPFMRPLIVDYPEDAVVYNMQDEYLFGRSLLIAPILEEGSRDRTVYLPEGEWIDFWDGTSYKGRSMVQYNCHIERIPVFIKNNSVISLNLNDDFEIGGFVGNEVDKYSNLSFAVFGKLESSYEFTDDLGNQIILENDGGFAKASFEGSFKSPDKIYLLIPRESEVNENLKGKIKKAGRTVKVNNIDCLAYEIERDK